MTAASESPSRADIVDRLRAAGCVFAEEEADLLLSTAETPAELRTLLGRRLAGYPLEQVVGWAEFCGRRIVVVPGVFVPRRRTEFLVWQAVDVLRRRAAQHEAAELGHRPVVLDLCCGSGALAAALLGIVPGLDVHAADVDPVAVECAHRNLDAMGAVVYEGDLFDPLPAELLGRIDILIVNAPYVPTSAVPMLPPEARLYEPAVALDGGADGLDVARRVVEAAPAWLGPHGTLLIETSREQAPTLADAVARGGLSARVRADPDVGATVVIGARATID